MEDFILRNKPPALQRENTALKNMKYFYLYFYFFKAFLALLYPDLQVLQIRKTAWL